MKAISEHEIPQQNTTGVHSLEDIWREIKCIKTQLEQQNRATSSSEDGKNKVSKGDDLSFKFEKKERYSRGSATEGCRSKRGCPFCPIEVVHLVRHIEQKHNKTHKEALATVTQNRDKIKGMGRTNKKYRTCPVKTCQAKIKTLSQHLIKVHKYSPDRARITSSQLRYGIQQSEEEETTDDTISEDDKEIDREAVKSISSKPKPGTSENTAGNCVEVIDVHSGKIRRGWVIEHSGLEIIPLGKAKRKHSTEDDTLEIDIPPSNMKKSTDLRKVLIVEKHDRVETTSKKQRYKTEDLKN